MKAKKSDEISGHNINTTSLLFTIVFYSIYFPANEVI
jgi:hypothetical protein